MQPVLQRSWFITAPFKRARAPAGFRAYCRAGAAGSQNIEKSSSWSCQGLSCPRHGAPCCAGAFRIPQIEAPHSQRDPSLRSSRSPFPRVASFSFTHWQPTRSRPLAHFRWQIQVGSALRLGGQVGRTCRHRDAGAGHWQLTWRPLAGAGTMTRRCRREAPLEGHAPTGPHWQLAGFGSEPPESRSAHGVPA